MRRKDGPAPLTAVLCDGIVCDGFIWKYLWDDLSRSVSVAHWHYRGHGRSAAPADPERIGVVDHAADLDAVRHHLGDPEVVLCGHSFGTQVVFEAWRQRRERVRAMILCCGSWGRITHTFKGSEMLATTLPALLEAASKHPRIARALWSRMPPKLAVRIAMLTGEVDPHTVAAEDMEPYFRHVAHVDFPMFLRMLEAAGEHSAQDLLPSIDVPVLVIHGDRDSFTPPSVAEQMQKLLPKAELVMIPGGTHVALLEHHELVALHVEKFLGRLGVA